MDEIAKKLWFRAKGAITPSWKTIFMIDKILSWRAFNPHETNISFCEYGYIFDICKNRNYKKKTQKANVWQMCLVNKKNIYATRKWILMEYGLNLSTILRVIWKSTFTFVHMKNPTFVTSLLPILPYCFDN